MTVQEEILFIESELKLHLPLSYKNFLFEKGSDIAFGLPVLGLPATSDLTSVLGATYLLRFARPELLNYLVIRLYHERALCLDLSKGNQADAPLVEINIESPESPTIVHNSFEKYLRESEESKKQIEYGLRRIRNFYSNKLVKTYTHNDNSNRIPFKARDWRIHRCCVHDLIVGLTAFKYSEAFNGIEVDVFLTTDHPEYEEGHGTKALMTLILSDAYRNGTGMEVRFTRYDFGSRRRVADIIPRNLLSTINSYGIKLQKQGEGIISHHESINIFSSLLGIQNEAKSVIKELEIANEATLQGICFLINSRVWTIEQINWLLLNALRVKGITFGRDNPENRTNYSESLSLGRSVLALTKFKEKIEISSDDELNEVEVNVKGEFFNLLSFKPSSIEWLFDDEIFQIGSGELFTVLSRPRSKWINIREQIIEDINAIRSEKNRKVILYSNDVLNYADFHLTFSLLNKEPDLNYLIVPFSAEELDEEVIGKMKKAKTYRA
jgi:hypothetical protein